MTPRRDPDFIRIGPAPCEDGEHHTEYLLVPTEPGHVTPFPAANYGLTTARHRDSIRRQLRDVFDLILDEPDD